MKSFLEKLESDSKTHKPVVMAFGRMNPPTTGHEKLVDKVKEIGKDYKAPHHVIISHSNDAKKNPLDVKSKLKHVKRFFPNTNIETSSKEQPTFLQHAARLHQMGHDHLIMVAGSDRVNEYQEKLKQYNGTAAGSLFNFKKIEVKSAGQRDPDADGAEGMSASKMRDHAKSGDFNSFRQGVPPHVPEKHAKELFRDVRKGMGMNEEVNRGLFKAIFVTGGPGSGKDIIIREAIAESKAVEFNSIQAFDLLMDKQKLSEKTTDYRREAIRNRGPLIINGPADDHTRMITIREELEEFGYETIMVFVDTTNEASKERNEKLNKSISESIRYDKWQLAQSSKEAYRQNFSNFIDFNNSSTFEEIREDITDTYGEINRFIEDKNYNEIAFSWLESRGKISITSLFKENENVKKNSRFFESYKTKRTNGSPSLNAGTGPKAEGPGSELPDNRAGDSNADNIKWDGNKKRGGYNFRTYTEESPSLKVSPIPKEDNFSKDKEKVKRNRFRDSPTVNQRMRNITTVGPEFDTRQQGTVYPMSGLGDVTYREHVDFKNFRESYNDPADSEMGVYGVLGGATNKEPMENPRDKFGSSSIKIIKKKKK
jgi:predicted kinase